MFERNISSNVDKTMFGIENLLAKMMDFGF